MNVAPRIADADGPAATPGDPTVTVPADEQLRRERSGRRTERLRMPRTNRIPAFLLMATAALAPLPFGSTDPPAVAFWCIVMGLALACANPAGLRVGQVALLGLATIIVAGYAFVLHEQLAEQPWIAPFHPVWREAAKVLSTPLVPSVSVARHQPWLAVAAPLACLLSLVGAFVVGADRYWARKLLQTVAWSGAAYALYGIAAHVADPTHFLWREKQAYITSLTGTFINRNTAAVYFGSCAVVWLLLLSEAVRRRLPPGPIHWRKLPQRVLSHPPRDVIVAFAALFVCLAAMFMTSSRAGVVLALVALVLAFLMYFRRDLPSRAGRVAAAAVSLGLALLLLQFLGAGTSDRFDMQGWADGGRAETYRATWRMIAERPWFGTGLGTFAFAYPPYRSSNVSLWGVWDRAHSTPLEIAAEMGLPVAALVLLGWLVMLACLIAGAWRRRRDLVLPVAGLSVALLAAAHSLIDFSLQIPGFAIVAFTLIGAATAQSFKSLNPPASGQRRNVAC
jgi:O-antigen ligase